MPARIVRSAACAISRRAGFRGGQNIDERTSAGLDAFRFAALAGQPGLVHGIFGRAGGVSPAPYDSLNVGRDVGDAPAHIERNYALICEALGVVRGDLVMVRQVHSNRVGRVGPAERGRLVGELDGLFTDAAGVPLVLRFADCTPILVYDPVRGALGVAHAGWRGTLAQIGARLVQAMASELGSQPADMVAGIGPAIGPCCYAVGPDVAEATRVAFGEHADGLLSRRDGAVHLDLWAANRLQLERAGVGRIEVAGVCTACHHERYFSHRADAGRTGRFAMVAMLRGARLSTSDLFSRTDAQE